MGFLQRAGVLLREERSMVNLVLDLGRRGQLCTGPVAEETAWNSFCIWSARLCAGWPAVALPDAHLRPASCLCSSVAPRRHSREFQEACHWSLTSGGRPGVEAAIVQRHARKWSQTKM